MLAIEPLAAPLVRVLARLGVDPLAVVATHAACGLAAAALIGWGAPAALPWAAALLLVKTVLDNVDGALARRTGRVTLTGRYFDTGADLIVNLALFLALNRYVTPLLTLPAFALLTLYLSLDHNLERLYREQRRETEATGVTPGGPAWLHQAFARLYERVLAPQDRWIERLEHARFHRLSGTPHERAPLDYRLAWSDMLSTASLVNLGLSTQLTLLAAALLLGEPGAYVAAVYAMGLYVLLVQVVRNARFRAYLRRAAEERPSA